MKIKSKVSYLWYILSKEKSIEQKLCSWTLIPLPICLYIFPFLTFSPFYQILKTPPSKLLPHISRTLWTLVFVLVRQHAWSMVEKFLILQRLYSFQPLWTLTVSRTKELAIGEGMEGGECTGLARNIIVLPRSFWVSHIVFTNVSFFVL